MSSIRIFIIFTFCLVALSTGKSKSEECENDMPFVFDRLLTIKGTFIPGSDINRNRDDILAEIRKCGNQNRTVEEVARYLESFAFDASGFRVDPFSDYDGDVFQAKPALSTDLRIVMASFYDMCNSMNGQITRVGWLFLTKRDIQRGNETIPARSILRFNVVRLQLHGQDFCLRESMTSIRPPVQAGQHQRPIEYVVQSAEWGSGVSRGVATFIDKENPYWDINIVMTFPGDI